VIGGLYRLEGAWIGALAYALIDNYSREWVPDVGNILGPARFNTIIGLVFLIIVLLSPGGLVGIWEDVRDRIGGRRRGGGGTPTTTTTAGPGTGPAPGTVN
jgi:branched-chain amino acid transport system permease protein